MFGGSSSVSHLKICRFSRFPDVADVFHRFLCFDGVMKEHVIDLICLFIFVSWQLS